VAPGKPLPLSDALNPAWAEAMARFRAEVVKPLINDSDVLTEAAWGKIIATFTPYDIGWRRKLARQWRNLGCSGIRAILASGKETITALIAKDKALEPEANAIAVVEKLIRYHRDLYGLLNILFPSGIFTAAKKSRFSGRHFIFGQRACDLCLTVEDPAARDHAGLSGTYLSVL